jgi:hypothetical protein
VETRITKKFLSNLSASILTKTHSQIYSANTARCPNVNWFNKAVDPEGLLLLNMKMPIAHVRQYLQKMAALTKVARSRSNFQAKSLMVA